LLFRNNQNIAKRLPPPFNWAERFVLQQAACANVVNEEAGALLRDKGYKGRVAYMPYGVNVEFYRPHDPRQLREALGLKGMVFGYMGRLVPEKGLQDLIDAFSRFHPEEDVSLLVIGNGPLADEIAARFATPALAGRARLLSAVEHREVPKYLSLMSTLVLPSRTLPQWKEQFGRIIIEAMACGVPVIGSNSGEIPHLLGRLGAGLIVPEGDIAALHGAMRRLLEVPGKHDELRELGRLEVEQQYAHSALAYRLRQLLEAIVTDSGRGGGQEDALPSWAAAASDETA
jgi:glycosyltransferase involved in cell wall biosynthesis